MATLSIRTYPDAVLRARCHEIEDFGADLERLAADMIETMYAAPGIGLAASQVGVEKRLAVVDLSCGENPDELIVLVNPVVAATEGSDVDSEGCLSLPDFKDKVERPESIRVRAQDLGGAPFELDAGGLLARAIQHEIDHLDGILFVDRLSGLRRQRARRYLRRLEAELVDP